MTERDVLKKALDHACPNCGAKPGIRCRILTPNKTNPNRTRVDVRTKPCGGRALAAYRAMLTTAEGKA